MTQPKHTCSHLVSSCHLTGLCICARSEIPNSDHEGKAGRRVSKQASRDGHVTGRQPPDHVIMRHIQQPIICVGLHGCAASQHVFRGRFTVYDRKLQKSYSMSLEEGLFEAFSSFANEANVTYPKRTRDDADHMTLGCVLLRCHSHLADHLRSDVCFLIQVHMQIQTVGVKTRWKRVRRRSAVKLGDKLTGSCW